MQNRANFSLTQLEYVLAVHKLGHFAKAAEACHVTQPTLSMQIQKLEETFGVMIFDRAKKPILLTEAGKKIIDQIKQVLFEARKIDGMIQTHQGESLQGELKLAVIPTVAPYLLPRLLPILEKTHPNIRLRIRELQTDQVVEALRADEMDVGLLATPLKLPRVLEHPLFYEPFFVLCREDHELTDKKKLKHSDLKFHDIWLLEEGHCFRNQVLDLCSIRKDKLQKNMYQFESGNLETLKNLVISFGGYTLLPTLATESFGHLASEPVSKLGEKFSEKFSERVRLIPFERPIPAREIGLVYVREHYKSDLIEALASAVLDCIPPEVRKIRPKDLEILPVG